MLAIVSSSRTEASLAERRKLDFCFLFFQSIIFNSRGSLYDITFVLIPKQLSFKSTLRRASRENGARYGMGENVGVRFKAAADWARWLSQMYIILVMKNVQGIM